MNEEACTTSHGRRPSATFPDIPPADLCRRHSCLDNFVLSACVTKASDNLARLDEVLRRQRLTDTVKRSYRAAVARRQPSADGGGGGGDDGSDEGDESPLARRLARTGALLLDGRPPSGRLARDVHGLLENLGTLLRRLERDIHKTWARIQQLETSSAAVQRDMRQARDGCAERLESRVQLLRDDWHREQQQMRSEYVQAQQQGVNMAASIATLQQRVCAIGTYVQHVRDEATTVGEEARHEFAELRELKQKVREVARKRREAARRTCRVREMLERHESIGEIRTLQRVVRRKQLSEQLLICRRDAAAGTSALNVVKARLAEAVTEVRHFEAQVSESLIELAKFGRSLPEFNMEDAAGFVDKVYVEMKDAVVQAVQKLAQTRSRQMQTDIACRDRALQIGKLRKTEEELGKEKKQLEIEIEGVKITKICSSRQIRKNVNIITMKSITTRRKIQENVNKCQEAHRAADGVQPEIFELQSDIRDTKVKLKSVLHKKEPILGKLNALRKQYQHEEDEERRRIEFAKNEYTYQGQVRHEEEERLITAQNQLQIELERYELTVAERETLEDTFASKLSTVQPALDRLIRENAVALRRLAAVAQERSAADNYIDVHGVALMTQRVAVEFGAQVQEAEMFETENHVVRLTVALAESQRLEAMYVAEILQLQPRRDQLAEDVACLDSELHWRRCSRSAQTDRLRELAALVDDWDKLRHEHLAKHQLFLGQARRKTDALWDEYRRGVRQNAELHAEYAALVERWLAERMRTAGRFLPQLSLRSDLCNRLQVVRLVRAGVYATDRTLGLRHLYFSGEHQRGQARLGELYNTVRGFRDDIALAGEHVVRMFIGLMKGEVAFVRRAERETNVREEEAQTDDRPPTTKDRKREEGERREKQKELAMRVAELGRADTAGCRLPPVRKQSEKPIKGMSKLHNKDAKLHDKTRLPKI